MNKSSDMPSRPRIWLMLMAILGLLALASYFYLGDDADLTPPYLDFGGKQGFITNNMGFANFTADDAKEWDERYNTTYKDMTPKPLAAGVNWYHSDEPFKFEDIVKCIHPKAEQVLFAYYTPGETFMGTEHRKGFHLYPDQKLVSTEDNPLHKALEGDVYPPGRGFAIIAKEDSEMYCFNTTAEPGPHDIESPIETGESGWLLVTTKDETIEEAIAPVKDSIVTVWKQTADNEFSKVTPSLSGDYPGTMSDYHLLWIKLDVPEPQADPAEPSDPSDPADPSEDNGEDNSRPVELDIENPPEGTPTAPAPLLVLYSGYDTSMLKHLRWEESAPNEGAEIQKYVITYTEKETGAILLEAEARADDRLISVTNDESRQKTGEAEYLIPNMYTIMYKGGLDIAVHAVNVDGVRGPDATKTVALATKLGDLPNLEDPLQVSYKPDTDKVRLTWDAPKNYDAPVFYRILSKTRTADGVLTNWTLLPVDAPSLDTYLTETKFELGLDDLIPLQESESYVFTVHPLNTKLFAGDSIEAELTFEEIQNAKNPTQPEDDPVESKANKPAPILEGGLTINYDDDETIVSLKWPDATSEDGAILGYRVDYKLDTESDDEYRPLSYTPPGLENLGNAPQYLTETWYSFDIGDLVSTPNGEKYVFSVRAISEYGKFSERLTGTWSKDETTSPVSGGGDLDLNTNNSNTNIEPKANVDISKFDGQNQVDVQDPLAGSLGMIKNLNFELNSEGNAAEITWEAPDVLSNDDVYKYYLYLDPKIIGGEILDEKVELPKPLYEIPKDNIKPGEAYQIKVQAVTKDGTVSDPVEKEFKF